MYVQLCLFFNLYYIMFWNSWSRIFVNFKITYFRVLFVSLCQRNSLNNNMLGNARIDLSPHLCCWPELPRPYSLPQSSFIQHLEMKGCDTWVWMCKKKFLMAERILCPSIYVTIPKQHSCWHYHLFCETSLDLIIFDGYGISW